MLYIGLMSGTSADGIDAALVDIDTDGVRLIKARSEPYSDDLRHRIQQAVVAYPLDDDLVAKLDDELGICFADATNALLRSTDFTTQQVSAIGSHGQTLRHEPNASRPYSLQIGNGAFTAQGTGITTINDFRNADIQVGGQGAPLAPAFHNAVFRSSERNRAILNIGGIANLTYLPADAKQDATGFDSGPGNTLLDAWVRHCRHDWYDADGRWARSGRVDPGFLATLLTDPYFHQPTPKSTGLEHFNLDWVRTKMAKDLPEADVQATLLALTVHSIAGALKQHMPDTQELYVCGGGVHNRILMEQLATALAPLPLATTEELGIHPDWVEAAAFAWLAHRRLQQLPGNLPSVTGAREAVLLGVVHKPLGKQKV